MARTLDLDVLVARNHASPARNTFSGSSPIFDATEPETTNAITPLACRCGGEPVPGGYTTSTSDICFAGSPGRYCLITSCLEGADDVDVACTTLLAPKAGGVAPSKDISER